MQPRNRVSAREKCPQTNIEMTQLPNMGAKSAAMLASVGITTLAQLRQRGAVAAYLAVKRQHAAASLNLLYALVAALDNVNWKAVQRERKLELMLAIEDYERHTAENHG